MSFLPAYRKRTRVAGTETASSFKSKPLTALKSAALAPMPSARDRMTTTVHPLARSRTRTPWRTSLNMVSVRRGLSLRAFGRRDVAAPAACLQARPLHTHFEPMHLAVERCGAEAEQVLAAQLLRNAGERRAEVRILLQIEKPAAGLVCEPFQD